MAHCIGLSSLIQVLWHYPEDITPWDVILGPEVERAWDNIKNSAFLVIKFKKGTEGTEAVVRNYLDANANGGGFFQNRLLHLTFKAHLSKEILLIKSQQKFPWTYFKYNK